MKILTILIFLQCSISVFAQRLAQNAILTEQAQFNKPLDEAPPNCEKYKRMKLAGIALSAGGGGIFAAGAVTAGIGLAGSGGERFGRSSDTGPLLIGGLSCLAIGAACIFAGLPLADIGHRKSKHCLRQSMILSTTGSSLAINF